MIEIHCKYDELLPIHEIKFHPKNRNNHPKDQIERLAEILKYQGWRYPIKISNLSGCIVSGHGRVLAARHLGLETVPIQRQDYETQEQEYADLISDNSIASWSELDLSSINSDIVDLGPDFNIDLLGIKDFVVEPIDKLEPQCDEDDVPDTLPEPKVVRGDLFTLGNHRLLCGDSTMIDDVERLMDGKKADITFTSPPYNAAKNDHFVGKINGFDKKYNTHSDELSDDAYLDLLTEFTTISLTNSAYCFVNIQLLTHNRIPLFKYQERFQSLIKDVLIWNKKQCPPNIVKGAFNTKWEYIFCFSEDNETRGFPCDWRGQHPNVVETESNAANEFADTHKAGFPVALPNWFLEKFDFVKTVYDPFGGTGTTIIACEKTNRTCFMMELDPIYCAVILDRWQKYSGKKAYREDGVLWDEIKGE